MRWQKFIGETYDTLFVFTSNPGADTTKAMKSNRYAVYVNKNYITFDGVNLIKANSATGTSGNVISAVSVSDFTMNGCVVDSAGGGYLVDTSAITSSTIKNSIISNGAASYGIHAQGTTSLNVYNNTLYNLGNAIWAEVDGVVSKNNIFHTMATRYYRVTSGKTLTSDYNLFAADASNRWYDGSSNYSTLAAWKTASGQDGHSVVGDPRFRSAATKDYTLKSGTPAENLGVNLYGSGVKIDFNGKARPTSGKFSAGAHQRNDKLDMGEIGNRSSNTVSNEIRSW